jgi:hypothetical protein
MTLLYNLLVHIYGAMRRCHNTNEEGVAMNNECQRIEGETSVYI